VKQVPYAAIRLVGGLLASLWCIYVFLQEGAVGTVFLGLLLFTAGWFAAQRFGRPVGISNRPPWLDTVLPMYPFLGNVSIAVAAAIIVLFFAGMSLSLGLGAYANVKVALGLK